VAGRDRKETILKTTNWKDIAELIGIAAIVASLVFVGMQMKQSQEIALSVANQTRADATINMLITSAENPNFISAFAKTQKPDREPLTPEEYATMSQYARALLYLYENNLFQLKSGFGTEHRWQASRKTMMGFLISDYPIPMRSVYEQNREDWEVDFQNVVDGLIEEIESNNRQ